MPTKKAPAPAAAGTAPSRSDYLSVTEISHRLIKGPGITRRHLVSIGFPPDIDLPRAALYLSTRYGAIANAHAQAVLKTVKARP